MNINSTPKGSSGYFYCAHCQENVSESTFRRHQVMSKHAQDTKIKIRLRRHQIQKAKRLKVR